MKKINFLIMSLVIVAGTGVSSKGFAYGGSHLVWICSGQYQIFSDHVEQKIITGSELKKIVSEHLDKKIQSPSYVICPRSTGGGYNFLLTLFGQEENHTLVDSYIVSGEDLKKFME
ncbi:MAG TPA: hypothetical protein VIG33_12175 [Pseudobdellovibrionaceae bacterium]|jgi:hypothetical protein